MKDNQEKKGIWQSVLFGIEAFALVLGVAANIIAIWFRFHPH